MSLIADGLLIATCLTTALYCLVLSRRLRRLSDTGDGIGQQILRLNAALAETKAAVSEIRSTSKAASDELEQDIEAAKRQSQQLQLQIARALKSGVVVRDTAAAAHPAPTTAREREDETGSGQDVPEPDAAVVDFEAADRVEDDLDDDLRHADNAARRDSTGTDETESPAEEESFVGTGDISEAEEHWPFDESEDASPEPADLPEDAVDDHPDDQSDDPSEEGRPQGRRGRGRRSGAAVDGDGGLLRVERMAV